MLQHLLFLDGVGGTELILIFFVVLLLFGPKKIPELARSLGKGIRQFKDAANDINREIRENALNIDLKDDIVTKKEPKTAEKTTKASDTKAKKITKKPPVTQTKKTASNKPKAAKTKKEEPKAKPKREIKVKPPKGAQAR